MVRGRTDFFDETAIGQNVFGVRNEVFEVVFGSPLSGDKSLLLFHHVLGLRCKNNCWVNGSAGDVLVSFPDCTRDLHVLIERQAVTLPDALVGCWIGL